MNKLIYARLAAIALGLFNIIYAPAAAAYDENETTVEYLNDGWLLVQNPEGDFCMLSGEFDGGESLHITYDAQKGTSVISVSVPKLKYLNNGQTISLYVSFVYDDRVDGYLGPTKFVVERNEISEDTKLFATFDSYILEDVKRSMALAISFGPEGDDLVSVYSLEGSARAMTSLFRCANIKAGYDPDTTIDYD